MDTVEQAFWGEDPGLYNQHRHRRRFMPVKRGRKRTCSAHGHKKPCEKCFEEAYEALRQFDG